MVGNTKSGGFRRLAECWGRGFIGISCGSEIILFLPEGWRCGVLEGNRLCRVKRVCL
ncbi:hypothetical protein BaRGS_00027726, partial [Batillaria attramentaria]